ncbi:MAG: amino acid adenylation domain-containing protein [Bacteroidetes bacterium]|nr:amino acid adenylation domain-containing protein [Bacteroidota bacterium]
MTEINADIVRFLADLKRKGIHVYLKGGSLALSMAGGGSPDQALIDLLRSRKEALLSFLQAQEQLSQEESFPLSGEYENEERVPVTFAQKRIWIIDRLMGSANYHINLVLKTEGEPDLFLAEQAFRTIVHRHTPLRSVFRERGDELYQELLDADRWQMERSVCKDSNPEVAIAALTGKPFDLSSDFMFRASVIVLPGNEQLLVLVTHHIASDGWSLPIMVREFAALYNAYKTKTDAGLAELKTTYGNFARWQHKFLNASVLKDKLDWWEQKLKGITPSGLPADVQTNLKDPSRGKILSVALPMQLYKQIEQCCNRQGFTPFMVTISAYFVLLHRYTGSSDLTVGVPVANRNQQATHALIGLFVNTLAVRAQIDDNATFASVVRQVKQYMLESFPYQDTPFELIVDRVVKKRIADQTPVFQTMFSFQDKAGGLLPVCDGFSMKVVNQHEVKPKFDLLFDILPATERCELRIEYRPDTFSEDRIISMVKHYEYILRAFVQEPEVPVRKIILQKPGQVEALMQLSQGHIKKYSFGDGIVDLFEQAVRAMPENTAVIYGEEAVSYRQLNEKADQLCYFLLSRGVRPDMFVPLCIARTPLMIISILAILKAGAAYVPVDPSFPVARIEHILSDTCARIVICTGPAKAKFRSMSGGLTIVDPEEPTVTDATGLHAQKLKAHSVDRIAYVIYTSGSTGLPKGVVVGQQGVINLIRSQTNRFGIDSSERILQFSNFTFDASVEQIFLALFNGAALVLVSEETRLSKTDFEDLLKREKITHFHTTPGFIEMTEPGIYGGLKRVIAGGDVCSNRLAQRWGRYTRFFNEYGPTETTVTALVYEFVQQDAFPASATLPIGRPLDNCIAYILDNYQGLLPIGLPGELYIGGIQVAEGYLNRDALNKEKFIHDPFIAGGRLYRTGDIARYLPDGNIEFIGRADEQVKINGYRIELGEINAVLLKHESVKASVVTVVSPHNDEKELAAYFESNNTVDVTTLRNHLKQFLPDYMIPVYFMQVENLPLTYQGKIAKDELPAPSFITDRNAYVPPGNALEKTIALVWQSILGVDKIGIQDNFFESGGNSMKLIRMVEILRNEHGISLTPMVVFRYANISAIAQYLRQGEDKCEAESDDEIESSVGIFRNTIQTINDRNDE